MMEALSSWCYCAALLVGVGLSVSMTVRLLRRFAAKESAVWGGVIAVSPEQT
jgi:hypothetical protein